MASLLFVLLTWTMLLGMVHTSLAKPLCHSDESYALMEFKGSFQTNKADYRCVYPKVESWSLDGHGDCCSWEGVECDEATGHVIVLDLSDSCLFGTINSNTSIFRLLHLESLNLALNNFNFSSIPYGFGNLSKLQYLNLSNFDFIGKVPSDISQLSRLVSLDLSYELFTLELSDIDNFVKNLTMLREIDLSHVAMLSPFPHALTNFSSLKSLRLVVCGLFGGFPVSIFQLPNLEVVDIGSNFNLLGFFPEHQWGSSLKSLSLQGTNFQGKYPCNLSQLVDMDISHNKFQGEIPTSFANLTRLAYLDLSYNNFTDDHNWHWLVNLAKLTHLKLSGIQLSGRILSSIMNQTRWIELHLQSNNLQGEIPNSLWELKDLEILNLYGNNLSGTVDLHKLKNLEYLFLDFNNISFVSKTDINVTLPNLIWLRLESCNLHEFPKFLGYQTSYLDISSNLLETTLPTPPPFVNYYNISNNFLFGEIQSICKGRSLVILDLSINSLNGTIPSCLGNIESLSILNLGKNKLEGMIPQAYPKGCTLKLIDLTKNRLQGPVPRSLANCVMLEYLNLGYNHILDEFPLGLLELTELKAIILKSNKFHGPIEAYRSQFNFSNLHIMDLSNNNFNGELPSKLMQSFHAMKVIVVQDHLDYIGIWQTYGTSQRSIFAKYEMRLMNKGTEREFSKVPNALMGVDLSNNKFEGHIPDIVGDLKSLILLNLSNNILTGCIPPSLANLTMLESLDLSQNKLSGEIPQHLAHLTFLSSFNVSYNQLLGRIPQGSQFNTFGIDSYAMNEGLCGSPLPKNCITTKDMSPLSPPLDEENGEQSLFDLDWKVVLIGIGVGLMIGVVLGNLIIDEK
ncbi:hypothetical protein EUGRSUZ_E01200, partial [Eucalyptus grandis]